MTLVRNTTKVPKPFLAKFLRACARHGLGATLGKFFYE